MLSVGAFPYTHPTLSAEPSRFMNDTTVGLALRSTGRATPVALLGLAMLLGAGVSALFARADWVGWTTGALVCAVAVAGNPALFNGQQEVAGPRTQPASLPSYEVAAIDHLRHPPGDQGAGHPGGGLRQLPWGYTDDTPAARPPHPALRHPRTTGHGLDANRRHPLRQRSVHPDRHRELVVARPHGPVDECRRRVGRIRPDNPEQQLPARRAAALAQDLSSTPSGLADHQTYGTPGQGVANATPGPEVLALPAGTTMPAPEATYAVTDPRPLVRAESDHGSLIVAGNATGLESLAGQGSCSTPPAPIYFAGTLDDHTRQLQDLVERPAPRWWSPTPTAKRGSGGTPSTTTTGSSRPPATTQPPLHPVTPR